MAAIIDILIGAQNRTGPGIAAARANVASLGTATDRSAQRMQVLSDRVAFGQRRLQLLGRSLDEVTAKQGANSLAAQRTSLAYDREAASIQRTERALDRLHKEQQQAPLATPRGAVVPGSLAGLTGQGLLQGAGAIGIATAIPEAIGQLKQLADQGQSVQVVLDSTRASLGAMLGSQARGNQVMEAAIRFGDRFNLTQEETAKAVRASSQIIRTSTSSVGELLSVLGRLQVMSPEQSLDEAALAVKELASGDIQSLRERFEISGEAARQMKKEIAGGADAVQVLGRYLDRAGVTNGALEAGLAGAAGQQRELNKAMEGLQLQVNNLVTSAGWRTFLAQVVQGTTTEIQTIQQTAGSVQKIFANLLPQQVRTDLNWLINLEERASGAIQRYQQDKQRAQEEFLGIAQARRLAASEAKTAREDLYIAAPASVATQTASVGPYANTLSAPARDVYQVTVMGSLVHTGDVADGIEAARAQKTSRNGTAVQMGRRR